MSRAGLSIVAVLLLACVASGGTAHAQAAHDASDAASAAPAEPASSEEDDPRHREALERFEVASALFERGDPRGALAEMQAVYELLEGRPDRYVVLYNFGRIYEALHRYDRATELYRRYLAESPPEGEDRDDAEAALRVLERLLGTLIVSSNVRAEVWLEGSLVGEAPGEIPLPAGVFAIELRASGHETVRREIELAAGRRVEITASLARLSDVHGLSPAFALTSAAITVVSLGVGIGLGVHALSLREGANGCAPMDACGDPVELSSTIRDVALGADLAFAGAALFAVTATVLIFFTDWGASGEPALE